MAHEAGEENFFLFGLTAEQVAESRGWYSPRWHYEHEAETRAALDLIFSDHFSRHEPGVFEPLRDTLLTHGDYYMHLAISHPISTPTAGSSNFMRTRKSGRAKLFSMWPALENFRATALSASMRQRSGTPSPAALLSVNRKFFGERTMEVSPLAGKPADPSILINVFRLVSAYYSEKPDPSVPSQHVAFGTSGHRGCSLDNSFNEAHILAITQAICLYRKRQSIDGPLYIGFDTHALSQPAFRTALEVLAGNGVDVMVDAANSYTPNPVISHAILSYNRGRKLGLADGIVITPSHNPPRFGGFKYDPPHGGPADTHVTQWIQERANALIANGLRELRECRLSERAHLRRPISMSTCSPT
jgi:hypothetical protein